jgi:hypothetical protein
VEAEPQSEIPVTVAESDMLLRTQRQFRPGGVSSAQRTSSGPTLHSPWAGPRGGAWTRFSLLVSCAQAPQPVNPRSPAQSDLAGPRYVVAFGTEAGDEFHLEHLVEEQAHDRSGGRQLADLRMHYGLLRETQDGLDVFPFQFGIAGQDRIPGLAFGKLTQDDLHRDAGAPDDRPTPADARVNLDTLVHAPKFPLLPGMFQFSIRQGRPRDLRGVERKGSPQVRRSLASSRFLAAHTALNGRLFHRDVMTNQALVVMRESRSSVVTWRSGCGLAKAAT